MTDLTTTKRKQMFVRGFQMLVIGMMLNLGITIIAYPSVHTVFVDDNY